MKRTLKWTGAILVALLLAAVIAGWWVSEPRPTGTAGPAADALARKMEAAVDRAAWDRTGAIRWTFMGQHHYLWDKNRGFVSVAWDDHRVLLRTGDQTGRAWTGDVEVEGTSAEKLVHKAYAFFANDSFWLNPVVKLFDPGTTRELVVTDDGRAALLLTYTSGGVTPGDAYLWVPGPDGLPEAWRMWVQILPIGGIGNTWEGWVELDTGAKISTTHSVYGKYMEFITNLAGAQTLAELEPGPDPFAPLN